MREEMFRRTDQDRGGTITKEELTNVMSERGPSSAGVNIDQLFSQIDANEDGSIDGAGHHEFMSAKRPERPSAAEFAQKLCEKADGDGDGKLTQAEMRAALPEQSSESINTRSREPADFRGPRFDRSACPNLHGVTGNVRTTRRPGCAFSASTVP